jgi:hypothetical protein
MRSALAMKLSGLSLMLKAPASGVGHNPDSLSKVGSSNVGSRNNLPLRVIPDFGKVSENTLNSPSKQSCDVLHDCVGRS